MHLVFLLLISVIPMMLIDFLSMIIPFIFVLKILLTPFQVGCLASLYIDQFKKPDESNDEQDETNAEITPIDPPPETDTDPEIDEEKYPQAEQPVSEEPGTSMQAATDSFPEEDVMDEKMVDNLLNQREEKSDLDSKKDDKGTI